jgi:hypothetical protein
MRAASFLAVLGLAVTTAGCGTRSCKEHTLLVTVEVDGAAVSADALEIAVAVGSGSPIDNRIALAGRKHGTIEVTFPHGYPSGQSVTVSVAALVNGATLTTVGGTITLDQSCGALSLDFAKSAGGDGGSGTPDACVPATTCSAADSCGQISDGCGGQIVCGGACVVNAVYQPFGATGDVISIEGRFGAHANVNFPGGSSVPATVLGPTRLTVTVPAASGSGLLTVASNGTTNPFSFTHAAYAVAPQTFRGLYEQTDYARQTPTLGTQRWGAGGVTMPDRVWLIGGEDKTEAPLASVEEALIDGDGALRSFTTLTSALVTKRGWGTAVRTGSWVYAIGGRNAALSAEPTIERAPINADGSLGAFAVVANLTLAKPRFGHQSLVIGGYVYVLGGYTGAWCAPAPQLASVERAAIGADGTLGPFEDAGVSLTVPRAGFGVAVGGNYLYAVGGDSFISDMASLSSVDYAPIHADGTLGAFQSAGGTLPAAGRGVSAIVLGGKLWKMGDGLYSAAIHSDGTIDNFTTVFQDPHTANGYGTLVGDYYYMLGNGYGDCRCSNCSTGYFSSSQRVLLGSGAIGAFASPAASMLTVARTDFGLAVLGNHVYAIGGNMSGADVELATIGADGSVGNFAPVAGLALVAPRLRTTSAIVGNNVYIVGGVSPAQADLASVEVAAIQPDDTLGAFTTAAATLHTAGLRQLAVIGNGLCAFGGAVECATIAADGTIGAFVDVTLATTPPISVSGGGADLTVLPGGVYGIGGSPSVSVASTDDGGDLTSSFASYGTYSFIQSPGRGTVLGGSLYILGGFTGLDAASSVSHIALDPTTSKPSAQTASAPMQFKHDSEGILLVHGQLYVVGGTNGGMPEIAPLQ